MEVRRLSTWREELLASLVEENGVRHIEEQIGVPASEFDAKKPELETESFKDQVSGFLESWGEMLIDLGRGCRDIVQQSLITEDSFVVQKVGIPVAKISNRLRFLNDFLPEDRNPVHAWLVIFFVFIFALSAMSFNSNCDSLIIHDKEIRIHPTCASRVRLLDGRHLAYRELGVSANKARVTLIGPHSFLSSRLAGLPGIKISMLEEFGVRLVTYDLPGFGESDPHPGRSLNSSAFDMLSLADAVGVNGKFWVLGYSSGSMHAWAALRYIPNRVAGATMLAPLMNPFEPRFSKEEMRRSWEYLLPKRKLMYVLARRFPKLLSFFYRQSFLSGKHGQVDEWMSVSLGRKDEVLIQDAVFKEFWHRDVEESVRQGNSKPFTEEAKLQVSNWGFDLAELQVQRKCRRRGLLSWLPSMHNQAECTLTGFLGPIHIWQGLDDQVVPPATAEYISRVLPEAIMHKLADEGHFSYFYFCEKCHRQIFLTLFGKPQGPLDKAEVPLRVDRNERPNTKSTTE